MAARIPTGLKSRPETASASSAGRAVLGRVMNAAQEQRQKGRKFGLTVGLAFVALGLVLVWRHRTTPATVMLSIGGLLLLGAFVAPAVLEPVERTWMGLAHLISKVTTPIFMGVVYFVVLTPIGFFRRRMSGSALFPKETAGSRWLPHVSSADVRGRMERQF